MSSSRALPVLCALGAVSISVGGVLTSEAPAGRARRDNRVDPAVVRAKPTAGTIVPSPPFGFTGQARLGFSAGDQWEPAIAADGAGGVYVLYPQYGGVPGCASCPSPTMILQVSRDGGVSWGAPRLIAPPGSGQWDAQIVVDPADRHTVFAAWLQNSKSDTVVARSDDAGQTWSVVVADHTPGGTDKPILAARGQDVYVAYNRNLQAWVASSHDGGRTFSSVRVNQGGPAGWPLAGGGAVDPAGKVYFGWAGYTQHQDASGPVNLYVTSSGDGGQSWSARLLDVSASPPLCPEFLCGWAYLGAQLALATDEAGTVYALWNAGSVNRGPERIYFSRSTDEGFTWSPRRDVSGAAPGVHHAFPAIVAGAPGDVRIAWMDARSSGRWNTYYRRSRDGGGKWQREQDLSTFVPGFGYIHPAGFDFPFGDYFELEIDPQGFTHAIWGEGLNYETPGSIWYARGE